MQGAASVPLLQLRAQLPREDELRWLLLRSHVVDAPAAAPRRASSWYAGASSRERFDAWLQTVNRGRRRL